MTRTRQWLLLAAAGVIAAGLGYGLGQHQRAKNPEVARGFTFSLPDLGGQVRSFPSFRGKVLLVNFWATWCPPCREEIPLLIRAQKRYAARGFTVVGIAVDDPKAVRAFSARFHINYPVLLGQNASFHLMRQVGDGQGLLPYSVIFSPTGQPLAARTGAFTRRSLQHVLKIAFSRAGQPGGGNAE
ncbi:MAG: TlpA disulfide reductase family protein [Acidiferrobacteraceae bacterium]